MTATEQPNVREGPGMVRGIVAMTRVEFRRVLRDRIQVFFIVVFPVIIIIVIGATIGAASNNLTVGVVDLDHSEASKSLVAAVDAADSVDVRSYDDEALVRQDIRVQSLVGGLVIPAGFSDRLAKGESVQLSLLASQTSSATPPLQQVVSSAVDHEGQQIAAARFATRVAGGDVTSNFERAHILSLTQAVIGVDVETMGEAPHRVDNRFAYTAPSNLVLFVFVNSLAIGSVLVESRRLGVTRRVLAAPLTIRTILLGSGMSRYLFALVQSALLISVGALIFGVSWGSPIAAVFLVLAFALVGTGAGLMVGAFARKPEQAMSIAVPVAIGMGMLGGCMWPLEIVSPTLRTFGHATPHAWAMDAWISLIFEGGGLSDIWPQLAVLVGMGVALLVVATWRLRRVLTS